MINFTFKEYYETGVLNGDDLIFFYHDVGLDNLQGWPEVYDWDAIVKEFDGILDIGTCSSAQITSEAVQNKIRFTVSENKDSDNGSKSAAFFRHLRNAFSHYRISHVGENYLLTDYGDKNMTMRGLVNAELLKKFCFRFFEMREQNINEIENDTNHSL